MPGHHGIPVLHRRHRADRVGAAQVLLIRLRDAPVRDLPLPDQIGHYAGHLLRRDSRVDPVLEIKVDMVGFETPQRPFQGLPDGFRTGIREQGVGNLPARQVKPHAELGGDHRPVPAGGQRLPHQAFVAVRVLRRAVHLGGIKESIPHFKGFPHQTDRFPLLSGRTVGVGKAHAAQPDGGNGQILAQNSLLHPHQLLILPLYPAGRQKGSLPLLSSINEKVQSSGADAKNRGFLGASILRAVCRRVIP